LSSRSVSSIRRPLDKASPFTEFLDFGADFLYQVKA
jgi:hypothetical protein